MYELLIFALIVAAIVMLVVYLVDKFPGGDPNLKGIVRWIVIAIGVLYVIQHVLGSGLLHL